MLSQVYCGRNLIKHDQGFPQPNVKKLNTFVLQESSYSAYSQIYKNKNRDGNLTRSQGLPKRHNVIVMIA